MSKKYIQILLYGFILIWFLLLLGQGIIVPQSYLRPVGVAITIVIFLYGIFERWLWQWRMLHSWIVPVPNIIGTWKGQLISSWIDPTTNQPIPPIEAYLIIRQTLSSIQVKLVTQQSSSNLINGKLDIHNNTYRIIGSYENTSKIAYREKSPIHYGSLLLEVHENASLFLEGQYWTDRKTTGSMHFNKHVKKLSASFEDAADQFKN